MQYIQRKIDAFVVGILNVTPNKAEITNSKKRHDHLQNIYCLCDLIGVENLKQAAAVKTAFLFCCGECVCGLFVLLTSIVLDYYFE